MTDEQSFLAAIGADRAADLPRLAYADWLDEHDRPARAELIRLQIERFRLPETKPLPVISAPLADHLIRENEFRFHCDWPPPDDLPVGRLYQVNDGSQWRCVKYLREYTARRETGLRSWSGVFQVWTRPEEADLLARERTLLYATPGGRGPAGRPCNSYLWSEPLHELGIERGAWSCAPDTWRRGFLWEISAAGDRWVEHADAILAAHSVGRVKLHTRPQVKRHRTREEYGWGGDETVWFTDRPAVQIEDLPDDGTAVWFRLMRHYWPNVEFVPPA